MGVEEIRAQLRSDLTQASEQREHWTKQFIALRAQIEIVEQIAREFDFIPKSSEEKS